MKKLLTILTVAMLPSSAFALIGFGIQGGQDMSKLGAYSYSEGLVSINALEMGSNPAGIGVSMLLLTCSGMHLKERQILLEGHMISHLIMKSALSVLSISYGAELPIP